MILYVTVHTDFSDLFLDYIEIRLATGKTVSMNWDESEIERTPSGFSASYKGVYFDEKYAHGRLEQLHGMKIVALGIYTELDAHPEITITRMTFEDGENSYEPDCIPYVTDSGRYDLT